MASVPEVFQSMSYGPAPESAAPAQAWLEQGARLTRTRRAVSLLEEALRGRVFVPKL